MNATRPTAAAMALVCMAACNGRDSSELESSMRPTDSSAPIAARSEPSASSAADATPPIDDTDPDIATMHVAEQASSKIGVPVDVLYSMAGLAVQNQPTSLNVAVVPRLEGTNMRVFFLPSESVSIELDGAGFAVERAEPSAVYRQRLVVTPQQVVAGSFRVQVIMDVADGRYAGIFTIPIGGGATN
jgi:hypothetical protein